MDENSTISRRSMIAASIGVSAAAAGRRAFAQGHKPRYSDVGIIIYPWEADHLDWPKLAAEAGVNTIAFHAARKLDVLYEFGKSDGGRAFMEDCRKRGLQVEFELHALNNLLSRELYYKDQTLFRLDRDGVRRPDFNCCPSSAAALEIVSEKAIEYGRVLKPASGRFYYWADDGNAGNWCHCPRCKGLSPSDQATLIENAVVKALRKHLDPRATLCHLAYHDSLTPPRQVKPDPHLFLEFAPIRRSYRHPIDDATFQLEDISWLPATNSGYLELLDEYLKVFPKDTAQIIEYWLDVSFFSQWRQPAKKLPWNQEVLETDALIYEKHGIPIVKSFALWFDEDYVRKYGKPPLKSYVRGLQG